MSPLPHEFESDEAFDDGEGFESDESDEAQYTAADAVYDEWLLANEAEWDESDESDEAEWLQEASHV